MATNAKGLKNYVQCKGFNSNILLNMVENEATFEEFEEGVPFRQNFFPGYEFPQVEEEEENQEEENQGEKDNTQ